MHDTPLLSWLIVFVLAGTTYAANPQYTVTDLGGPLVFVEAIDPQGNAVGSKEGQAALFTPQGTPIFLGFLPHGDTSLATNRDGLHGIVGSSSREPGQGGTHAFHRFNGVMRDLGTFGAGGTFSWANAMNGTVIVGQGDAAGVEGLIPLAWGIHGGPAVRLATLGGPTGSVQALRPSGVAVGASDTKQGEMHATLWIMGAPTDLTPGTGIVSDAYAVNMFLMIVGYIRQDGKDQGLRWTPQRGVEKIGTLPGHIISTLKGVNVAGVAVGQSIGPDDFRAVRVIGAHVVDLNTLLSAADAAKWKLEDAVCMNDQGVIGGQGRLNGKLRAFLLRPIPLTVAHQ